MHLTHCLMTNHLLPEQKVVLWPRIVNALGRGRDYSPEQQFPDSRIQNPNSTYLNLGSGIHNVESRFRNLESGIRIPDPKVRIPNMDCRFRNPDSGIQIPDSGIWNPDSGRNLDSRFRIRCSFLKFCDACGDCNRLRERRWRFGCGDSIDQLD